MLTETDILITGGSGFIGSHLADSLTPANRVTVLDVDRPTDPTSVRVIQGDIRDQETVKQAVAGCDIVFHEAALVSVAESVANPCRSHEINATGSLNVFEAAREHDTRVVVASSAAVYGEPDRVPIAETDPLEPTSPYGLDKLATDRYAKLYHDLYGLETVSLRYFNVYGPGQRGGQYAGVIRAFLSQARQDDPITIHGDGTQTRDFVHVDDIVRANIAAATTDAVGGAYNVGTGNPITIRELAERIKSVTESRSELVHTEPRAGDIQHSCADITRARESLGYQPTVSIDEGLASLPCDGS
ncbi:NAD-dependent epimerase/dehydratase family protein [Halalkalirubrum salinum]|uniref:NAD-dependent epimerase/dehydratase family protein n=1 Tax=Halalkalirubrum salinum TaxID=2563889 RepID=UPI0010FB6B64|nr:NAD-dependent epimerase/dehydratase family protein [Halalkalirubrum salinum]